MNWTAYIDETDTHGAPIMALGGFLSLDEKWGEFDEAWKRLLFVHNLDHSHAVDLINKKSSSRAGAIFSTTSSCWVHENS